MAIYSQASNSQHPSNAEVNHETGQYSYSTSFITLGSKDRAGFGAERDISLSYSTLSAQSSDTAVYGCGWNVGGYSLYIEGKAITLSNGQQFSCSDMSNGMVTFHDRKTQNFQVSRVTDSGRDEYRVYHKDGVVEVLGKVATGQYRLSCLVFPNGETFQFSFATINSQVYLSSIKDTQNTTMLKMEYFSGFLSKVQVWRGEEYATFSTTISKDGTIARLQSFSRAAASGSSAQSVSFKYAEVSGYQVINEVNYPEGATEKLLYTDGGHSISNSGQMSHVPRVNTYYYYPGCDSPVIEQIFEYPSTDEGSTNFLGFPNQFGWESDTDSLYKWGTPNSYSYWVKVTTARGSDNETVTKTKFNTFHLKTSEVVTKDGCTMETKYEYPCDTDEYKEKTFEEQPNTLLFATKTTRTFQEGVKTKEYVRKATYDDYGNEVEKVSPNGVVEKSTYYPVEGDGEKCPADPFGFFKRFINTSTTVDSSGKKSKQRRHWYSSLKPVTGQITVFDSVVKVSKIEIGSKRWTGLRVLISYFDDPTSLFTHNEILQATMKRMARGKAWTSTCDFSFDLNGARLTNTKTISAHDGTSFTTKETKVIYSDVIVRMCDRDGIISEAGYDSTGEVLFTTSASGSDYEERVTYEYDTKDEDWEKCRVCTQTDHTGKKLRITYNGADNIVKVAKFSTDANTYLTVLKNTYNDIGLIEVETRKDYFPDGSEFSSEDKTTKYDGWNQACEIATNDGVFEVYANDPCGLTRTRHLEVRDESNEVKETLASTTKTFDLFKNCTSQLSVSKANGEAESKMSYDGFGRMVTSTTPLGHTTKIAKYDLFDRVRKVSNAASVTFKIHYAIFSPQKLMAAYEIWEEDARSERITVGEQSFDGIGRVTQKRIDGVNTTYSYDGGNSRPSRIVTNSGNTIEFKFNSALGMLPSIIGTWRGEVKTPEEAESYNQFSYATKSEAGASGLLRAEGKYGKYDVTYGDAGKMEKSTQDVDGSSAVTSYLSQSLLGKPLSTTMEVDEKSVTMNYTYDCFGRLKTCSQSNVTATLEYDDFGRIKSERVEDDGGTQTQMTELTLDDLGREKSRIFTITHNGEDHVYQNDYGYDSENKMETRCVTFDGEKKLSEQYSYDVTNRLTQYAVADGYSSDFLPQSEKTDAGIAGIIEQTFTFNCRNNITTVVTKFDGGQSDTATYIYNEDSSTLASIEHTLTTHYPEILLFSYDSDGNLVNISSTVGDTEEVTMTYSVSGRLLTYKDTGSAIEESFVYDPFERVQSDSLTKKYYLGSSVMLETGSTDNATEFIRNGTRVIAEKTSTNTTWIGMDQFQSAVLAHGPAEQTHQSYDPYGTCGLQSRTGFKGEIKSRKAPIYLVNGGTRVYLPQFGLFSSLDTMSPFSGGGINPYLYCYANPVNMCDPSGHFGVGWDLFLNLVSLVVDAAALALTIASGGSTALLAVAVIGGTFGLVSDTLGIAADSLTIEDNKNGTDHSKAIGNLGLASGVFGVAAMVTDVGHGVTESVTQSASSAGKKSGKAWKNGGKPAKEHKPSGGGHGSKQSFSPGGDGNQYEREGYYAKKREDALQTDEKLIRKTPFSAVISSGIGVDISSVTKALDKEASISSRAGNGAWAAAQFLIQAGGFALLENTTWRPNQASNDSEEPSANSFMSDVVNSKYPI